MPTKEEAGEFGSKEALILAIGYIEENRDEMGRIDKAGLADALGITRQLLNKHFLRLRVDTLLREDRQSTCGFTLTVEGWKRYESVYARMIRTPIAPEIYKCEGTLGNLLPSFKDPKNIFKIAFGVMTGREMDLISIFESEKVKRPEYHNRIVMQQVVDLKESLTIPFDVMFDRFTLSGKTPETLPMYTSDSIMEATLRAEHMVRRLKVREAYDIFHKIAYERSGEFSTYRIFAIVGMIDCIKKMESEEIALKMASDLLSITPYPTHRVMLMKCMADILTFSNYDEALRLYHQCIKSLEQLRIPALKTGIQNNMGVAYLEKGDWEKAEDQWREALKLSKEHRYDWIGAVIKQNLADVMSHNGKFDRAKRLLNESKKFILSVDDKEGLSGYHYNMALVLADEGKKEQALKHFQKCEEFPLTFTRKREKRRIEFNKRFIEKGWGIPFPEKK